MRLSWVVRYGLLDVKSQTLTLRYSIERALLAYIITPGCRLRPRRTLRTYVHIIL